MGAQSPVKQLTSYASQLAIWIGKSAIFLLLIAILAYTQGLYVVDVQLRSSTPLVQVRLTLSDTMPRLSWRRLPNLHGAMPAHPFVPAATHEQACRQSQKQQVS